MRSDPYRLWGKETRWRREADYRFVPYEDKAPRWARVLIGAGIFIAAAAIGYGGAHGLGWVAFQLFDLVVRRGS